MAEVTVPPILSAIKEFVSVGVTDVDTELAFLDCARKLDGLDPKNGVGLLHLVAGRPHAFEVIPCSGKMSAVTHFLQNWKAKYAGNLILSILKSH